MFEKVLVANRGEIAVRVIRTLREMGIRSVAVYSEADRESLHVRLADEAICIGPADAARSYLSMPAIISAAEISGAQAIHPGYGFLSENQMFVEACEAHDIVFIGPGAGTMALLGNKAEAKKALASSGVPVVPGADVDEGAGVEDVVAAARRIGFPVMIKAAFGGGGRGIRVVRTASELEGMLVQARREAESAFGNGRIYLEKYIENPRHVEFQVLADTHGNVAVLGERDCTVQRRHQKLLEESPCPVLDEETRRNVSSAIAKAVRDIGYVNAGTFEFLLDEDGNLYFIEANTRLQVEHPVTEMRTGIDIVAEQVRIAAGETLSFDPDSIASTGHAIEFRINAEDPANGFLPCPGVVERVRLPGGFGVRVDTHLYPGCRVPPYYDSLIAKLIVWGRSREEAIARGRRALEEFEIAGIKTTTEFHRLVLGREEFVATTFSTTFVDTILAEALPSGHKLS